MQNFEDHTQQVDEMLRRMDEVICTKADKTLVTEFREYSEISFCTKSENGSMRQVLDSKIVDFDKRCEKVE